MISSRRTMLLLSAAGTLGLALPAAADSARQISNDGAIALRKLYASEPHARNLGAKAKAILVFPRIVKAGLLIGGQSGDGVLMEGGRTAGFYNLSAASFGLQAGAQTFSYALFFMNTAALAYLDKSDGWSIGSGPSVVVLDKGAARSITSTTLTQDVYAIPFGQSGLMAGIGLEGSKITRIHPN